MYHIILLLCDQKSFFQKYSFFMRPESFEKGAQVSKII